MSFYPDFIQILSRFYLDFILILSRFYPDFIQIFKKLTLSKYYPDFTLESVIHVGQGISVGPGKFDKKNKCRRQHLNVIVSFWF